MDINNPPQDEQTADELLECFHKFQKVHVVKQSTCRGIQWQYIACGEGDQVLMVLPGAFRRAESAFNFISLFEDTYRLVTPSYPPVYSVEEMLAGLIHILDNEGIAIASILGQSYGGWMAQLLIRQYPDRFDKLILSSTGPLTVTKNERRLLPLVLNFLPKISTGLLQRLFKKGFRSELAHFPLLERPFWEAFSAELLERLAKTDILSHFQVAKDAIDKGYMYGQGEKSNWDGKVLIVGSDTDKYVSGKDRERLLGIYPRAEIEMIPNAGHVVAISEPVKFAAAVREFLSN
jgi:pimeloyl-ACP methyl ester carboxylesterase